MKLRNYNTIGLIVVMLLTAVPVEAAIPQISYQAKITDASNVTVVDGDYNVKFALYTVPTGGSPVWEEERKNGDRVTVTDGLLSVMLGEVEPLTGVDFSEDLYLGVTMGDTALSPTFDTEMVPRKPLGSVPVAFTADTVDGIDGAALVRNDAVNTIATSSADTLLTFRQEGTGSVLAVYNDLIEELVTLTADGTLGFSETTPDTTVEIARTETDGYFAISTDDSATGDVFLVDGAGLVGIGSADPVAITGGISTRLHVKQSDGTGDIEVARFEGGSDADNTYGVLRVNHANDRGFFVKGGRAVGNSPHVVMGTTDISGTMTEIMSFATGNVGIGDTSPQSLLTVGANDAFQVNNAGQVTSGSWQGDIISAAFLDASLLTITDLDTSAELAALLSDETGTGAVVFGTAPTLSGAFLGGDTLPTADSSNDLGSPTSRYGIVYARQFNGGANSLDIRSTTGNITLDSGPTASVVFSNSGTEGMRIDSDGDVGIGTTNPGSKLTIDNSSNSVYNLEIINGGGSAQGLLVQGGNSGSDASLLKVADNTNTTTFFEVTDGNSYFNNGFFGIGTDDPQSHLHISAGAANIEFTGDVSGNSYLLTDGPLRIRPNGESTNRISFAGSAGNFFLDSLGVGTSPATKFDVSLSANEIARFSDGLSASAIWGTNIGLISEDNSARVTTRTATTDLVFHTGGVANNLIEGAERMRIDAVLGYVGIGNDNPEMQLDVKGTLNDIVIGRLERGGSSGVVAQQFKNNTASMFVGIDANENFAIKADKFLGTDPLMIIERSGEVGIGVAAPTAQLHTDGTIRFAFFGAGSLTTDANGNVTASSDERLKDIIGDYDRALDAVLALEPVQYRWKEETGYDATTVYTGFSAQNVQLYLPEAVSQDKRGYLTLSDRPILAAVVNAIKELWNYVSDQDDRIVDLESENRALESRLSDLETEMYLLSRRNNDSYTPLAQPAPVPSPQTVVTPTPTTPTEPAVPEALADQAVATSSVSAETESSADTSETVNDVVDTTPSETTATGNDEDLEPVSTDPEAIEPEAEAVVEEEEIIVD